jgi:hypothetical protein
MYLLLSNVMKCYSSEVNFFKLYEEGPSVVKFIKIWFPDFVFFITTSYYLVWYPVNDKF